jgi:hypothetical protein
VIANLKLQPVNEWQKMRGFSNLLWKENRGWWRTRRWWINAVIWVGSIGGLVFLMAFVVPTIAETVEDPNMVAAGDPIAFGVEMGRTIFFELGTIALAVGIIVLSQDMIVQEKQLGLTDWLLAKPVARRSYILSKFLSAIWPILILFIGLPSLTAYGLLTLRTGAALPLLPFLGGVGMMAIHTIFYLSLTLMLGVFFQSRAPILGLSLGVLLGGNILSGILQPVIYVTPWMLGKLASSINAGHQIPNVIALSATGSTLIWIIVFLLVSLRKFNTTEF